MNQSNAATVTLEYTWTGWDDETDLGNADDREGVEYLSILDPKRDEVAVIIHRNQGDAGDAVQKARKEAQAQAIVDALNGTAEAEEELRKHDEPRERGCECQGSDDRYCALHGDGDQDYYGRRWA